jgi:hypothetical protein
MFYVRMLAGALIVAWLAIPGGRAHATAVFSDTVLARGPENLTVVELPIDAIGNYEVTATDLQWLGTSLQALSFGVFTSGQLLKSMQGPGTFEFYKASSDKVFLQIYSRTTAPKFAGLISVLVESAAPPVPLPSSLLLLVSGIGAALLSRRRSPGRSQYVKFA